MVNRCKQCPKLAVIKRRKISLPSVEGKLRAFTNKYDKLVSIHRYRSLHGYRNIYSTYAMNTPILHGFHNAGVNAGQFVNAGANAGQFVGQNVVVPLNANNQLQTFDQRIVKTEFEV